MQTYRTTIKKFKYNPIQLKLEPVKDRVKDIVGTMETIKSENFRKYGSLQNAKVWVKHAYDPWRETRYERLKIGTDIMEAFGISGEIERNDIMFPSVALRKNGFSVKMAYIDADGSRNLATIAADQDYIIVKNSRETDYIFYA